MRTLILGILLTAATAISQAETILVGPDQKISRIADAARIARDGDTVLVVAGVYRGDVAVWPQKKLHIRSVAGRSTLIADGRSAEGKAIWVIRNGDFEIEGFEFTGARVPAGNGAGIRFERGRLQVDGCFFHDNQMGLLTGNDGQAVLHIRDTIFANAPRQQHSLPHLLYVGRIARLDVRGSRFENGYRGHLVKSRARHTELRYNLIADGPLGQASYEVDLPDGGEAILVGNVIEQGERSENKAMVAFGAEGFGWAGNRLTLAHNTLINKGATPASLVRTWRDQAFGDRAAEIETWNNLLLGASHVMDELPGDHRGNVRRDSGIYDAQDLDGLLAVARGFGKLDNLRRERPPRDLVPAAQFASPVGSVPLDGIRDRFPGAVQK